MYNRYLRNDYGTYTRITPPPASEPSFRPTPPHNPPPEHNSPPAPPPQSAEKSKEKGLLDQLLKRLHLEDLDSADLMLLALLFFLFEEKADDELLIALGLLLIL